ncbi:FUSC family protein [Exiguobacterium algae]|uniref:FUSC family protein n=1 Tax=Exiguobacterium algae TaxID=2751250 RepID=UPI001BEA27B2|nr:aromatic acid exporter family protein [Exiguobacterium algae]
MKFGARTIKTGLSVAIVLLIAEAFQFQQIVVPALAASLALLPSVYQTGLRLIEEMKGNLIGALLAVGSLLLTPNPTPIAIGFVIIIAISILLFLNLESTTRTVILTTILIMEGASQSDMPIWRFAGERYLLIMMGVTVALLVNALLLPPRYERKLEQQVTDVFQMVVRIARLFAETDGGRSSFESLADTKKMHNESKQTYAYFEEEIKANRWLEKKKAPIYRRAVLKSKMIETNRAALHVIEKLDHDFHTIEQLPTELRDELYRHIRHLLRRHERLFSAYELENEHIIDREEDLIHENFDFAKLMIEKMRAEEEELILTVVPLVATMTDWVKAMNELERYLVTEMKKHGDNLKVEPRKRWFFED